MTNRLAVLVGGLALAATGWMAQHAAPAFPHATHAKLFITCAACHGGLVTGDSSRAFPARAICARCHDGAVAQPVAWTGPSWPVTNLKFSHVTHASESAKRGTPATCTNCHADGGDTAWMHVAPANPKACLSCHVSSEHLAPPAACATCHVPLAQAKQLPESVVAGFPKPQSHAGEDFVTNHGPKTLADLASCATCHARESCARCHPNAAQLPEITALASDARVARLVRGRAAAYPTPASHERSDWALVHGSDATRAPKQCGDCHTQTSCKTCHIGSVGGAVIRTLPAGTAGGAPGVTLVHAARAAMTDAGARAGVEATLRVMQRQETTTVTRVAVHPADFLTSHKTFAASGTLPCLGCHQTRECATCHGGTAAPRTYHAADYVSRHGTDAFRQSVNCSSCHRVETFCRSCHQTSGLASTGATRGSAHSAQPLWLLQHGQAARQGLTGCTSCHQQTDCLRCHSTLGQNVNPHGPGFNASAMAKRNGQVCFICHVSNPIK